jgi:hypothetical protein
LLIDAEGRLVGRPNDDRYPRGSLLFPAHDPVRRILTTTAAPVRSAAPAQPYARNEPATLTLDLIKDFLTRQSADHMNRRHI